MQDNAFHIGIEGKQRRETERRALEIARVRAEARPDPSHSGAVNTGNTQAGLELDFEVHGIVGYKTQKRG